MALTSQQFNKKLATKEELKKEVSKLETKVDKLEQKMDNKFDTAKNNLDEFREETNNEFDAAVKMFASKEDLKELRQDIASDVNKKFDKILTAVDGITKQYQEVDIGFVLNQGAHDRFEEKLLKQKKELELLKKN